MLEEGLDVVLGVVTHVPVWVVVVDGGSCDQVVLFVVLDEVWPHVAPVVVAHVAVWVVVIDG